MRRQSPRLRWPLMAVSVALVGLALPSMNASATEARVVVAGTAPVPANVTVIHQAITTSFDVTLAPRSSTKLTNYISSLSDTASPNYHDYLSTDQFAQRFGASQASVAAVRAYFEGLGLHVGSLSRGRLVLHVQGTTTEIAKAFNANVETVRRSSGVLAAQLAAKGTVPASIAAWKMLGTKRGSHALKITSAPLAVASSAMALARSPSGAFASATTCLSRPTASLL